jgi:UDP-N-acetylmuramoyl-L-alanyl-D-glutamate--2,6-diaminopimelate ligase
MFTIGVTGTNGKTSTTHLITAALQSAGRATLRIGTVGVALDDEPIKRGKTFADFLATMQFAASRGCAHAVVETTSQGLAQGYARHWRFDLGVFTNLSPDHFTTHGSWEHYLAAKAQLFVHLGPGRTAVLNAGDPHAVMLDQAIPPDVIRRWFWAPSRGPNLREPDLAAAAIHVGPAGTTVELAPSRAATELGGRLQTTMVGEVFGENLLAAALAGLAAGLPGDAVAAGLAACPVVPGRFEVVDHGPDRPTVVVDYAHTPDALVRTCATGRALVAAGGRLIVVFGVGGGRMTSKRGAMGEAVGAAADLVIVTNDNPRDDDPETIAAMVVAGLEQAGLQRFDRAASKAGFDRAGFIVELDRARAIELALAEAEPGDVVVVAGKGHEQGQIIAGRELPFCDVEVVRAGLTRAR